MYGDLGRMYWFGLDFEAIDMIKEWLVKGAKEAEERTLGINTTGSSKLNMSSDTEWVWEEGE